MDADKDNGIGMTGDAATAKGKGTALLTKVLTQYGKLTRTAMFEESPIETIIFKAQAYHPNTDAALLRRAYAYAEAKHEGQSRRSGEPYITHPVAVTTILTELEMDDATLVAGLLHDVVEDCGVSREQIAAEFGEEIADLVDGVTKLKLADFEARSETEPGSRVDALPVAEPSGAEAAEALARKKRHGETTKSAANLRKILLAMAKDLRVMVIKLADRLHNMRTLGAMPEHRQKKVAQETLQIFAPLAHRLGIWQIKWQLEDLAFKYLNPDAYNDLKQKLDKTRSQREKDIATATETLKARLAEEGITAEFQGRPKHLYSIYNKMQKSTLDLGEIYDLIALRVIVPTVADCYQTLGLVHQVWMPLPGRFDDYIAKTKSNGYQSLHTKVHGPNGEPLEIQIRTTEMHRTADFGIAAHWQYKEGGGGKSKSANSDKRFDNKLTLLRQQLFDWQYDAKEPGEFLRSVVGDLFTDQVFVFTPKGDVLDFPLGATPVDAAYRIHSALGEHCAGAKVNGKIVPLTYHFKNGDIVEILTRPNANPSLDWLASAKTSHARTKIKAYFRKLRYASNVARGRELLQKELERLHLDIKALMSPEMLNKIGEQMNHPGQEDLLAAVGYGDAAIGSVVTRMRALMQEAPHEEGSRTFDRRASGSNSGKLQVGGDLEDVAIVRAKCCQPVPGDEVSGYMTRGKGIALHRHGCANVAHYQQTEPERLIEIDWKPSDPTVRYSTDIKIELVDRLGLLEDIGKLFSEAKTFIQAIRTRSHPNHTAVMQISFDAADTDHIAAMITRLQRLTDVVDIHRLGANEDPVD